MLGQYHIRWLVATISLVAICVVLSVVLLSGQLIVRPEFPYLVITEPTISQTKFTVTKFTSEQEFKDYLTTAQQSYTNWLGGSNTVRSMDKLALPESAPTTGGLANLEGNVNLGTKMDLSAPADRVSETNVQVLGIDEPDIVKTDGSEIYFSLPQRYYLMREMMPIIDGGNKIMPPYYQNQGIKVIKAWPPADLTVSASIDNTGDLLLIGDNLVVFAGDKITGYDVSNYKAPVKKWETKYQENNQLVSARLYKNQIYLITRGYVKYNNPCPIKPLLWEGHDIVVPCTSIYHPVISVPTDVTYTVTVFDPATGKDKQTTSFVGSADSSQVYMSGDNIYITYSYPGDLLEFIYGAVRGASDLFPSWFLDKLGKVRSYDLSQEAKMAEFEKMMTQLQNSLSNDERMKLENEFQHRMSNYADEHKRDLERTGLIKIAADQLEVVASTSVAGRPLNQFSLDEYQGNLRVATTIGASWFGSMGSMSSVSDVYVLDDKLKILGVVKDLGETEKIYSVRFVGEMGYVVTFRQTDPFYVLDLSKPKNPVMTGELKIPGFSSYLHPLAKNIILGVGQENWKVKLSLFDVSNPSQPKELDKYLLDDSWSEVQTNHHAFLQDPKHQVVFLPGGQGGYVFSYRDNKLSLASTISNVTAKRALYLNDYLYVISEQKITVLNENDWLKVNELDLSK